MKAITILTLTILASFFSACSQNQSYDDYTYTNPYENEYAYTNQQNQNMNQHNMYQAGGVATFVEPQYGLFQFQHPATFGVNSFVSLQPTPRIGFSMTNQNRDALIFLNDEHLGLFYNPAYIQFGTEGQAYGGGLIMRKLTHRQYAEFFISNKGFQNVEVGSSQRASENRMLHNVNATYNGEEYQGEIFVRITDSGGDLFWNVEVYGLLAQSQSLQECRKAFNMSEGTIQFNQQVVQQINQMSQQMVQQGQRASQQQFQQYMNLHGQINQMNQGYIDANQSHINSISENTKQYNLAANGQSEYIDPNSGRSYHLEHLNNGQYYIDGLGNIFSGMENPDQTRFVPMNTPQQ